MGPASNIQVSQPIDNLLIDLGNSSNNRYERYLDNNSNNNCIHSGVRHVKQIEDFEVRPRSDRDTGTIPKYSKTQSKPATRTIIPNTALTPSHL